MMKISNFLVVCLILWVTQIYAQDTLRFPKGYATSTKLIKIAPDQILTIDNKCDTKYCDSLYIFNKKKYKKYQFYKSYIANDKKLNLLKNVSEEYEQTIQEQKKAYSELDSLYDQQAQLHERQMAEVKKVLETSKNSIQLMRNSMESANESIEISQRLLKEKRRKSFFDKLGFLGGGVGIGVLIGLLTH